MPDDFYRDLLITDDDLDLDPGGQPEQVAGRACIAQDLQHMIRESGLLVEIIGERDAMRRKRNMVELTLMVDRDYRIRPGTARLDEVWTGRALVELWLTAETVRYGAVSFVVYSGAGEEG